MGVSRTIFGRWIVCAISFSFSNNWCLFYGHQIGGVAENVLSDKALWLKMPIDWNFLASVCPQSVFSFHGRFHFEDVSKKALFTRPHHKAIFICKLQLSPREVLQLLVMPSVHNPAELMLERQSSIGDLWLLILQSLSSKAVPKAPDLSRIAIWNLFCAKQLRVQESSVGWLVEGRSKGISFSFFFRVSREFNINLRKWHAVDGTACNLDANSMGVQIANWRRTAKLVIYLNGPNPEPSSNCCCYCCFLHPA